MKKYEDFDFTQENGFDSLEYEVASTPRRIVCFIIDLLIVCILWYLVSYLIFKFHKPLDDFMLTYGKNEADFESVELYNLFRELILRQIVALVLCFLACMFVYLTLVPACIGNGQTVGKLIGGIKMLDLNTLEEIKPLKLIYREFVLRMLLEIILIIPGIISVGLIIFGNKPTLHDSLAKTVVIRTVFI